MKVQKRLVGMIGIALVIAFTAGLQIAWTKAGKNKTEYWEASRTKAAEVSSANVSGEKSVTGSRADNNRKTIIIQDRNKLAESPLLLARQKKAGIISPNTAQPNIAMIDNSKTTQKRSRGDALNNPNSNGSGSYYSHKVVTLIYHHISTQSFSGITIKPERFEGDLKMLRDKGFNVIRFSDMIKALQGNSRLPENAVVITFDDGISSLYTYGFPMLKKYNVPVASFLVTSRNESYSNFKTPDSPLSPQQITTMARSGLVEFESHTNQSHERVTINAGLKKGAKLTNRIYSKATRSYETEEEYVSRITDDLVTSSDLIEQYTGRRATVLCFPFGIYDKQVIDIAESNGYMYFVTTQHGVNYEDSKKNKIYRIRAGDADKTSESLFNSILAAAR